MVALVSSAFISRSLGSCTSRESTYYGDEVSLSDLLFSRTKNHQPAFTHTHSPTDIHRMMSCQSVGQCVRTLVLEFSEKSKVTNMIFMDLSVVGNEREFTTSDKKGIASQIVVEWACFDNFLHSIEEKLRMMLEREG